MSHPNPQFIEDAAFFQANLMIRQGAQGAFDAAAATYARFVAAFDHAEDPDASLARVIKRLGRERAGLVGIDKATIDRAVRSFRRSERS